MESMALEISFDEFQKLSKEERKELRKKGDEICKNLAQECIVQNPDIDYVVFYFGEGEIPKIQEKHSYDHIQGIGYRPYLNHLEEIEKGINKPVFAFHRSPLVETIHDLELDFVL
jgi:hypothetical protein